MCQCFIVVYGHYGVIPHLFIHLSIIISMISEVNQTKKVKYHDITYMWNLKQKIQMNLFTKQIDPQT